MAISLFEQALQSGHHSKTSARQLVYECLVGREPITMAQLVALCIPVIDRASVYRTIALFEQLGIVQRLQIGWKYKLELSNNFQDHHHHLTCISCGQVIPLGEDQLLEDRLRALARQQGFQPQDHQLEIRGHCRTCALKELVR